MLVAVEAGGATVVMVAKVGGELLFARNILATWAADPGRIGVEINRSLLYANQQFGNTVDPRVVAQVRTITLRRR